MIFAWGNTYRKFVLTQKRNEKTNNICIKEKHNKKEHEKKKIYLSQARKYSFSRNQQKTGMKRWTKTSSLASLMFESFPISTEYLLIKIDKIC